ncbi:MAG TPA: hypothetical protein VLB69_01890 [Rudaea sp.]|nr:hypothetical protein [Rudaea sp.]
MAETAIVERELVFEQQIMHLPEAADACRSLGELGRGHCGRMRVGQRKIVTTIATSVTGFGFPFDHLLPSHVTGIISLAVLALALPALYIYGLAGAWRWICVVAAVLALYLNVFVLVVRDFGKMPALHSLAPTQAEPPFAIAQGIVLVAYLAFGALAVKKFHPRA